MRRWTISAQTNFNAVIQQEAGFIFVALPFSPREAWGAKPRYHVTGTINGVAVRGTLGAQGSDYFLRLSKAWLRESSIVPGNSVTVSLSFVDP